MRLLELFLKSTQIPQASSKFFSPHMAFASVRLKKKIPRVWQLSLWPLQVVVFGPRLGGKLDGIHLCCCIETPQKKTCGNFFATKRQGGWVVFPSQDAIVTDSFSTFHFCPGKGFALKLFFDFFCNRATQQVTYFCGTSNSLRIFVAKNHRSERVGMSIVLFRMKSPQFVFLCVGSVKGRPRL